jgi:hypothetical protein
MVSLDIIAAVRRFRRVLLVVVGVSCALAAAAVAAPVQFFVDSLPASFGRDVVVDFNPSTLASRAETPDSIAFLLPAHWRFDHRAVKRECTQAQAAAVRCPAAAQVGYGHSVIHFTGYLFPGGESDAVAYITPYVGVPSAAGDPASLVLEVEILGAKPFIDAANQYLSQKIREKYSIVGRVERLRGTYGLEASFSGFPGGMTVPPPLAAAGVTASITRFKLQIGAVRRVKKPTVDKFKAPTPSGGTQTIKVRDHVLIGRHLLRRGSRCPASRKWPWELKVGFPEGVQNVTGTVTCGGR